MWKSLFAEFKDHVLFYFISNIYIYISIHRANSALNYKDNEGIPLLCANITKLLDFLLKAANHNHKQNLETIKSNMARISPSRITALHASSSNVQSRSQTSNLNDHKYASSQPAWKVIIICLEDKSKIHDASVDESFNNGSVDIENALTVIQKKLTNMIDISEKNVNNDHFNKRILLGIISDTKQNLFVKSNRIPDRSPATFAGG